MNSKQINFSAVSGKIGTNPLPEDKVVISGISGTFPKSKDVHEFRDNLFGKVDMLEKNNRFFEGNPELPSHSGIVPDINYYDTGYFGMHIKEADSFDASTRILLEKTVEAIFDAGVNPSDLENTKTGVYLGFCGSELINHGHGGEKIPSFHFTELEHSIAVNRISYFLKVKGPSFAIDTGCSSSLYALDHAYRALGLDEIDHAIVAGSNLPLNSIISIQQARMGFLSKEGVCRPFDKSGKGYVKADAVVVIFLQKLKSAKRVYAQIVYCKTNEDGFKEQGIMHPSREGQKDLLLSFYDECGVDRYSLSYMEAHGTGTPVGDPIECGAIDDVLTKNRNTPLLIGSVKSNMGHAEYVAGMCAIAKCIIAMETGLIPPNIHYETPRDEIVALHEGRLKVVTEATPFADTKVLIGISSYGFGGANGHTLLQRNPVKKDNKSLFDDYLPILVCVSGRTEKAVSVLLDQLCNNKFDIGHIKLLQEIFKKNVSNHLFRGYSILSKSGEMFRSAALFNGIVPTLYLAFGELNYWYDIGKELLSLPLFRCFIQRIQENLLGKGINFIQMLLVESEARTIYHILGAAMVQIALVDLFKLLQMSVNQTICFSYGNIANGYYNNLLTFPEAIDTAFAVNDAVNFVNNIHKSNLKNKKDNSFSSSSSDAIFDNLREDLKHSNSEIRNRLLQDLSQILKKTVNAPCLDYFMDSLVKIVFDNVECPDENVIIFQIGSGTMSKINGKMEVVDITTPEASRLNFIRTIGRLYEAGLNPDLTPLYPEIPLPVARGTRMISPYIKWKHDRQWFVRNDKTAVAKKAKSGNRTVVVDLEDQTWTYLQGHVVDGRNLFPAMGYIFLVLETFSLINDTVMSSINVIFEDCRFLRATKIPEKGRLEFRITIQKQSGNFEVVEGGEPVVTGRIYVDNTDETYTPSNPLKFDDIPLTSTEIYKELRLHGYFYKNKFRGLQEYHVNSCLAFIKWEENWVTFIDNMLQIMIFEFDQRRLYVPTYISKIAIPVKRQLEWITQQYINAGKSVNLPVLRNKDTGIIRCGTISICGVMIRCVPRIKEANLPILQTHKFVPNVTCLDIQESVRVNTQIIVENILLYKCAVVEVIDEFTVSSSGPLAPIMSQIQKDIPMIQFSFKILSNAPLEVEVPVENSKLRYEKNCQLLIATKILERPEFLKDALFALKNDGFIISREDLSYENATNTHPDLILLTFHKTGNEVLILLQKKAPKRNIIDCRISSDDFSWLSEVQNIVTNNENDDIVLYSHNEPNSGILGLMTSLRKEMNGKNIRCFFLMDTYKKYSKDDSNIIEQLSKNMKMNVYKNGQWGTYRHLLINKVNITQNEHSYLNNTISGDISSLKWFQGPLRHSMPSFLEKQLVYVYYSSVNFKDIMVASGKLSADVLQKGSDIDSVLGCEFSGKDASGNRVMGTSRNAAISNLVLARPQFIYNVPDSWTLEEAATVPVVYFTAIYSMLIRGHLQCGDSILIHSGTAGVGQAAIRLAIHYKCTVFTTVCGQTKRDFLKSIFPELKDSHIGNSHDCTFEQMVIKETNGRGVDMVLNSLADEKLIASVRCLAKGGRFIEIGKFDMTKNSLLNLLLFEKEASFHGIMLNELIEADPFQIKQLRHFMKVLLDSKVIKPLNSKLFPMEESEQAFKYMTTGQHMGKVVIQIREPEDDITGATIKKHPCISRYWCDPDKVYIIIGGLGGFGLEFCGWLILRGARKLVLVSRKGITTGYQKFRCGIWQSYEAVIKISTADVTTKTGCENLIKESEELGTIHSVFNLALVLKDSLFENQTVDSFLSVFAPKVQITQNLDEVTRDRCPELRDFVVFSSLITCQGNAGQTNYGMASSAMERICENRKSDGYPALAIQWGIMGDVGIVSDKSEWKNFGLGAMLKQSLASCLNVLDILFTHQEEVILSSGVVAKKGVINITQNMVEVIAHAMGIYDIQTVGVHSTFAQLGLDSITLVDVKQILERDFDIFLSAKQIRILTFDRLKKFQDETKAGDDNINTKLSCS